MNTQASNFYYSFLLLPREKREAIITLYEFCRRTDDIIDNDESTEQKSVALQQWRRQLVRSLDGNSDSASLLGLKSVVHKFKIPSQLFLKLIDGVAMDLAKKRYATFDELYPYCYGVGSTVGLMSIEIFGYHHLDAKQYAVNLGVALQLINILRDLSLDFANGRIYLPQEDLRTCGYTESELGSQVANHSFERLIRLECERARAYFQRARSFLKKEDLRLLYPAEAMARTYEKLLRRIERRPSILFGSELRLPLLSKLSAALSAWVRFKLPFIYAS